MTISRSDLKAAYDDGVAIGTRRGAEITKQDLAELRKAGVIEISRAVADLALANAKLTYALSRITDKLV